MNQHIESLRQFYADCNANDMQAFSRALDPNVVRNEFEGSPTGGTYRGIDEVMRNVTAGRGTWAEGSCDPEGYFASGDKVVVYLHAWVRVHGATEWTGGRFADGFVFQNGMIIEYHSFSERAEALEWAGIRAD